MVEMCQVGTETAILCCRLGYTRKAILVLAHAASFCSAASIGATLWLQKKYRLMYPCLGNSGRQRRITALVPRLQLDQINTVCPT
mmetsp:Transcript_16545/g.51473  ORF Transcript_16545/g.51473 Transcript_16545/m.51473 type:complete len:85 (+) Transcript_16545:1533-1787(+)